MRIAMIGQKGIPAAWGGVERHVEHLSTGLVKRGHDITVYCRKWYARTAVFKADKKQQLPRIYKGARLIYTPSIPTKHLDTITHVLFATLHALFQKYDVIHFHGVGPSLVAWIPRLFAPNTKIIATFHSPDRLHGKWGAIAKWVLTIGEWASCHFAHETITVSQTLQQYAADTYKVPTIYIPNGVSIPAECGAEDSARALSALHLRADKYFLLIARFVSHKNIHLAIEAWRRALRDYPSRMRGLKFVIIGGEHGDNIYSRTIRRMARTTERVILAGWQDENTIQNLLSESIALIQPSQSEGMSLVMLEAMGSGKPVIASDLPEHRELIRDSRFRFDAHKISQIEERIVWLTDNPEIARVEGLKNREIVERFYNWNTIVRQTENIYMDAVFNREWSSRAVPARAD